MNESSSKEVWEVVMNSTCRLAMSLKKRYLFARKKVLQAIRYINGYLEDYDIEIRRNLNQNPIEFTIRVYWIPQDMDVDEIIQTLKKEEEKKLIEINASG